MNAIEVKHLAYMYPDGTKVLHDVCFSVKEGEHVALIGANGAGSRWTENRVSDFYDETKASDKITVYNGGGKFWISSTLFDSDAASVAAGNTQRRCASTVKNPPHVLVIVLQKFSVLNSANCLGVR